MESITLICHDAGGAEILSSWAARNPGNYSAVLEGPAVSIFARKLGWRGSGKLAETIQSSDLIVCGTSWQSNLEKKAIGVAKKANKKVVTFLDHWINYEERFCMDGRTLLPDELWVGDDQAKLLAENHFPGIPIKLVPNPYFIELQEELAGFSHLGASSKTSILYVCEPISEHSKLTFGDERYLGYTEVDALRYFLDNIDLIVGTTASVVIRPHPSENPRKYDWVKGYATSSVGITVGGGVSLIEEIASSAIVVGCESMAMVVGLLAGKQVLCSIPPGGRLCVLPHKDIVNLELLRGRPQ